jgi:antitoxin component YwqK of YwqJK toxin-antitoxin module
VKLIPLFYLLMLFATLACKETSAQERIADTVFYNKQWQICEEPIASYYRVGELVIDSFWYYRGVVKDYTVSDSLIMEGEYDRYGYRQGSFKFYYANGQLYLLARYEKDKPQGLWQWWYKDGKEKAQIKFSGDMDNFQFLLYKNEMGMSVLENGTGSFEWDANPFAIGVNYHVRGTFEESRRSGRWIFSSLDVKDRSNDFIEAYGKGGKLKKVERSGMYGTSLTMTYPFSFITPRLKLMENMAYDPLFRRAGDSLAGLALYSYLMDKTSLKLKVKQSIFDSAFLEMVQTLDSYKGKFKYMHQDINGKIEFRLGEKGILEDIEITGTIDSASRKFMVFLMEKFMNIDMPGTADVALESYHTIYFYTVDIKDYFPAEMRNYVDRDFFITALPKDQMVTLMNAQKKTIRKYIRKLLYY